LDVVYGRTEMVLGTPCGFSSYRQMVDAVGNVWIALTAPTC